MFVLPNAKFRQYSIFALETFAADERSKQLPDQGKYCWELAASIRKYRHFPLASHQVEFLYHAVKHVKLMHERAILIDKNQREVLSGDIAIYSDMLIVLEAEFSIGN